MAPKAAEPPPPEEGAGEPDPWETQEVVCGVLDGLFDDAFAQIQEKARRDALVPFVVGKIGGELRDLLAMHCIDFDIGEPAGAANWSAGEDLLPPPIDQWSRGAIPIYS